VQHDRGVKEAGCCFAGIRACPARGAHPHVLSSCSGDEEAPAGECSRGSSKWNDTEEASTWEDVSNNGGGFGRSGKTVASWTSSRSGTEAAASVRPTNHRQCPPLAASPLALLFSVDGPYEGELEWVQRVATCRGTLHIVGERRIPSDRGRRRGERCSVWSDSVATIHAQY
jgi:hypothetical protein